MTFFRENFREFDSIRYVFYAMQKVKIDNALHKRYWISLFSQKEIKNPSLDKQQEIVSILDKINAIIDADKKQLELLDEIVKSRFLLLQLGIILDKII